MSDWQKWVRDWQKWNDMSDTQRLVSWREACDQLAEARAEVERLTHDVERHQRIATEHIAEAERLTGILQAHNDECDRACREDRDPLRCDAYLSRGRTCPDCPMDEKINFRLPDPTTGQ